MSVGLANRHTFPSNRSMIADSFALQDLPMQYEHLLKELVIGDVKLKQACETVSKLWTSFTAWGEERDIYLQDDALNEI